MWWSDDWRCKETAIANARSDRQEVYNPLFRQWHWRVAYEQLVFSHHNAVPSTGGMPYYRRIVGPLLLLAGEHDNYNFSHIHDATRDLAPDINAIEPSKALFLRDTGHSIHNERPRYLAKEIFNFLAGTRERCGAPRRSIDLDLGPLSVITEVDDRRNPRPYMWTGVMTLTGRRLRQHPDEPNYLVGEPEYLFATGTHAHLGFGNSYPGGEIEVPSTIGGPARSTFLEPIPIFEETGMRLTFPAVYVAVIALVAPTGGQDTAISAHQLFNYYLRARMNTFANLLRLNEILESAQTYAETNTVPLQAGIDHVVSDMIADLMVLWNGTGSTSLDGLASLVGVNRDEVIKVRAVGLTERDLVDQGYVHPFSESEGSFENERRHYQLAGQVRATRRLVPIDCPVPDRRLRITAVATRLRGTDAARTEEDVITHYGGVAASELPWILSKPAAAALMRSGEKSFFVLQEDGDETEVLLAQHPMSRNYYLRTEPNETEADNLLSLPDLDFYAED
jgi:hypothetical protein